MEVINDYNIVNFCHIDNSSNSFMNSLLVNQYLSSIYLYKQESASNAGQLDSMKKILDKKFSDRAKELYPNYNDVSGCANDVSGYVALLKRAIDKRLIDSKILCDDIKSINNYDKFLDLAKHAINAKVLSEADKLALNKEFLKRILFKSEDENYDQEQIAKQFIADARKLYQDDDSGYVDLLKLASSDMNSASPFMNSFRDAVNQLLLPNTAMAPTPSPYTWSEWFSNLVR